MSNTPIIIEEYSPDWPIQFQQLKSIYLTHLAELIADIQHVGSTSVPGLAAKPVIDIDIIILDKKPLKAIIEKLNILGYKYMGDLGISDREAFKAQSDQVPYNNYITTWPKHHLYVCPINSDSLKNHLTFRDYLRCNANKAQAYGDLKRRLALEDPYDINSYVERKTPFITEVLREAGMSEVSISGIAQENRIDHFKTIANKGFEN